MLSFVSLDEEKEAKLKYVIPGQMSRFEEKSNKFAPSIGFHDYIYLSLKLEVSRRNIHYLDQVSTWICCHEIL